MRAIWAGALLAGYLLATGIALVLGHARVSSWQLLLHFLVLAVISAATWMQHVPRWTRQWLPLLLLIFLYSEIPILLDALANQPLHDATIVRWEHALFAGRPSVELALRFPFRWLSEALHAAYLSYYGVIVAVPIGLYLARREAEFHEAVFVLMLVFVVCFSCYIVFPVAGPRYFISSPADAVAGPFRFTTLWLLERGSARGTAFPSSHVAVAAAQSVLAWRYFRFRGLFLLAVSLGLAFGAIYGGFHYAVDVAAGAILGLAVALGGLGISRRFVGADQAKASAPT